MAAAILHAPRKAVSYLCGRLNENAAGRAIVPVPHSLSMYLAVNDTFTRKSVDIK